MYLWFCNARSDAMAVFLSLLPSLHSLLQFPVATKVQMKRKLFFNIYKICRLKYTIPKFETFRMEIDDFTSPQRYEGTLIKTKPDNAMAQSLLEIAVDCATSL